MDDGLQVQKAIDGLVNKKKDKAYDYAITIIDGVIPGVGLAKDIKNHIQQDRIVKVLTMLNDRLDNLKTMFKQMEYDENLFDIFYKLLSKTIESGSERKRAINISLFIDFYKNPDSSKLDFSFSMMDSISSLTNQELELLAKLTNSLEEYLSKNKHEDHLSVSITEIYETLDKDPIDDFGNDIDAVNYMFSRLSYAGFLIVPYGAVISATVFSHRLNMTIFKRLFSIFEKSF